MRNLLLSAVLCTICGTVNADVRKHYLLLPDFLPAITREMQPEQLIYTEAGISLAEVDFEEIEAWSEIIHSEIGGCGGFIDVTDRIEAGVLPEMIVLEERTHQLRRLPYRKVVVERKQEIERLIANASADRYWDFLTELTSFPDRSATSENGKKAAEFLRDRATQIAGQLPGFKAELVATGPSYIQPSVVVTIPGTDPSLPGVVIGGHMDTFTNSKPGADDDGSGSAVVMEALTTVARSWVNFKHTIYFMWYAAEERGLVGSSYVVKKFTADKLPVKAAIQFDMVGYNSDEDASDIFVISDNTDPTLNSQLRQLITTYTDARVGETRCGYACSDHANWHRAGVPAVFPFETSFDNMNSRLHTGEDKMAFLDKDHAFRFVQVALAFLGENGSLNSPSLR